MRLCLLCIRTTMDATCVYLGKGLLLNCGGLHTCHFAWRLLGGTFGVGLYGVVGGRCSLLQATCRQNGWDLVTRALRCVCQGLFSAVGSGTLFKRPGWQANAPNHAEVPVRNPAICRVPSLFRSLWEAKAHLLGQAAAVSQAALGSANCRPVPYARRARQGPLAAVCLSVPARS